MTQKTKVMSSTPSYINGHEIAAVIESASCRSRLIMSDTPDYKSRLVGIIDHTTLSVRDTSHSVALFTRDMLDSCKKAGLYPASVCVFPIFVESVGVALGDEPVAICSVAGGFPAGQTFAEVKMLECAMAVENGADEIDMLLDLGAFIEGRHDEASSEVRLIKEEVGEEVTLKIIVETGVLKDPEAIYRAAMVAFDGGADFVKSSTGKNCDGVTREAAAVLAMAARDYRQKSGRRVGVKFAGGISSPEDALDYVSIACGITGDDLFDADTMRIGSSSLLYGCVER